MNIERRLRSDVLTQVTSDTARTMDNVYGRPYIQLMACQLIKLSVQIPRIRH